MYTYPRAEDGIRTRDPDLGKVMLYQLSYFRIKNLLSIIWRTRLISLPFDTYLIIDSNN